MLPVTSLRPRSVHSKRAAAKPAMHAVAIWQDRQVIAIWVKDEGRSGRD